MELIEGSAVSDGRKEMDGLADWVGVNEGSNLKLGLELVEGTSLGKFLNDGCKEMDGLADWVPKLGLELMEGSAV